MEDRFIRVSGEDLVTNGRRILLRGFGIGSWMNMEHFMTGLPGNDWQKRRAFAEVYGEERAREFFETYLSAFITEADFEFLKAMGVNAVRLAFTYRHFEDDRHPGEFLEEGFVHLDRVLELCRRYGIYAFLDLHAAPGGQNPDSHADIDTGAALFWEHRCLRDRAIDLWRFIAARYREDPWVAGYDLLNEPLNVPSALVFNDFIDRMIEAVRQVDTNHVLFLEGDGWAQDFSKLHDPGDPQVAYSFHFYPLYAPVGGLNPADLTRERVETGLLPIIETLRGRFRRPLWCGETGVGYRRDEMAAIGNVLRYTLDILEENNVSWTIWAYKDVGAMGLLHPRNDTPWMELVREVGWDPLQDKIDAWGIYDYLQAHGYREIPDDVRFSLHFRLRGVLQHLRIEQNLKPVLGRIPWERIKDSPRSFHWENCEYHREMVDLVRGYTMRT